MDHSNRNVYQYSIKNKNKKPKERYYRAAKYTIELQEKILILERMKILKEHITEKYKEGRRNHIAEKGRENVDGGDKIWKVKRKIEKKIQTPYSITNIKGI